MNNKIYLDKDKVIKLNKLSKEYYKILNTPDLTNEEIRRLQYLVKTNYEDKEKQKIFSIINIYKDSRNIYLKMYLTELLGDLE